MALELHGTDAGTALALALAPTLLPRPSNIEAHKPASCLRTLLASSHLIDPSLSSMDPQTDSHHTALPRDQAGNPHQCSCGITFAQRQGLTRHIRMILNPSLCVLCDFKSARPYAHREHIVKTHPGLNRDKVLGKSAKSRRPAMPLTKRSAQPPRSLPTVERGQQMSARFQPYPLAPPLVVGVTSVSQPATSVAHNLQSVHPGPAITMHEHDYAPRSDFRDAPDLPAILPSTEERAELARDLDDSRRNRQLFMDHAVRLPSSAHPGESIAVHGPSNLGSPMPTPAPSASECVPLCSDSDEKWEAFFSEFYT